MAKLSDFLASLPTIEAPLYGGGTWTAPDIKKMVAGTPEGKAAKAVADAVKRRLGKAYPVAKMVGEVAAYPVTEPVRIGYRAGQILGSKNVPTYQKLPRMMAEALPALVATGAGGAIARAPITAGIAKAVGKAAGTGPAKTEAARLIQQAAGALWRASTPSVSKIAPVVIGAQAGAVGAGSYRALDQLKKEIEAKSKVGEAAKRILLAGGEGAVAGTVLGGLLGVPGAVSKYRRWVGQPGMKTFNAMQQAEAISPASLTDAQLKSLQKSNILRRQGEYDPRSQAIKEGISEIMKTRPATQTTLDAIIQKAKKDWTKLTPWEMMNLREYKTQAFMNLIPEEARNKFLNERTQIPFEKGLLSAEAIVDKLGIPRDFLSKALSHKNEGMTKGMILGNRNERLIYQSLPEALRAKYTQAIRENPGATVGYQLNEALMKAGATKTATTTMPGYLPRTEDISMTGKMAGIEAKTDDIIKAIGKPNYVWKSPEGTDSKVAVEWSVQTPFGPATIHDYKTGPQYEKPFNTSIKSVMNYIKNNKDWSVGGRSAEAAKWLVEKLRERGVKVNLGWKVIQYK